MAGKLSIKNRICMYAIKWMHKRIFGGLKSLEIIKLVKAFLNFFQQPVEITPAHYQAVLWAYLPIPDRRHQKLYADHIKLLNNKSVNVFWHLRLKGVDPWFLKIKYTKGFYSIIIKMLQYT